MKYDFLVYALCYIAEGVTAWYYFGYLFSRKHSVGRSILFLTLDYGLLFLIFKFGSFFMNATAFFLGNLILVLCCYTCGKTAAVLHSAFITVMMVLTEVVVLMIHTAVFGDFAAFTYNNIARVSHAVSSKILYFLVLMVFARLYRPRGDRKEESCMVILLCALPVASMVISVMVVYVGMTATMTRQTEILMIASVFLLLAVNLVTLAVNSRIQSIHEEKTALQLRAMKEEADADYYKMVQIQYDNQRVLIHDIKNHLAIVESLAAEGKNQEIIGYIDRLTARPELSGSVRLCDDSVLNAILVWYSRKSRDCGVEFHCDVRRDCVSMLDSVSVTALFGNLLSNACEAAIASEERQIELSVTKNEAGGVTVSLVNSCDTAPETDGRGRLRTVKKDREHHGLGLKSIRQVVEKYGGEWEMYYDGEEKRFHCIIQFDPKP